MAYLASLIYGYRVVEQDGSPVAQRSILNFKGTGVTVADNPSLGASDVTITAGTSSGITDLVADVAATGPGVTTATVQGFRGRTVASTAPSDAALYVYASPTSTWNPVVMTGDATMDRTGAVTVVGLQGYPVSTTAPVSGYVLTWNAGSGWWDPEPSGGGSGGITELTGDVTAGPGTGSQVATIAAGAVTNAKVSATAAIALSKLGNAGSAGNVIVDDGAAWVTVAMTGDIGISSLGVTAIQTGVIVNADVNASAAIAGTKISQDFGSQNIVTSGYIGIGSTVSTTGTVRLTNNTSIKAQNSTNASDRNILSWAADVLTIGQATGITNIDLEANQFTLYSSGACYIDVSHVYFRGAAHSAAILDANTTDFIVGVPIKCTNISAPSTPTGGPYVYGNSGHLYSVNTDGDTFQLS